MRLNRTTEPTQFLYQSIRKVRKNTARKNLLRKLGLTFFFFYYWKGFAWAERDVDACVGVFGDSLSPRRRYRISEKEKKKKNRKEGRKGRNEEWRKGMKERRNEESKKGRKGGRKKKGARRTVRTSKKWEEMQKRECFQREFCFLNEEESFFFSSTLHPILFTSSLPLSLFFLFASHFFFISQILTPLLPQLARTILEHLQHNDDIFLLYPPLRVHMLATVTFFWKFENNGRKCEKR